MLIDPINDFENDDYDETAAFECACGDPDCIGYNDDPLNIRIGRAWYAADCAMAHDHPLVVEDRERDARNAERAGK